MEKKFLRARSIKDIVISASLTIAGISLAALSAKAEIDLTGCTLAAIGILLAFILKTSFKDVKTGEKYLKKEFTFFLKMKAPILAAIAQAPDSIDTSEINMGETLKLDIYYSCQTGKAYLQLFEYTSHQYKPCSNMYEHEISNVKKLISQS